MNKKIIILSGGISPEREVSLVSAAEIASALQANNHKVRLLDPADDKSYSHLVRRILDSKADLVFIGLHGAEGEDGRLQALFDLHGIKYTGSGYRASALAMDKFLSTELASTLHIPVAQKLLLTTISDADPQQIVERIGIPCVVKPNDSGSSVGITIVKSQTGILPALDMAFQYSRKVICEEFVPGRELTVTILGDEALPVVEIIPHDGWYDFKNKYTKGNTVYKTPAALTTEETSRIQQYALDIFHLFGCRVYARVDFRFDGSDFYFLELNTLPGMTPLSLTPMAAREAGLQFNELLEKIIYLSTH
jgi:D-alanine-D-alanine ligase